MAFNQACILIQNCVGIGTDTPLGSLTVKQTSTDGGPTGGISIINDNNELKGSLFAGGNAPRPYGHLLLRDQSNCDAVIFRTTGDTNFILHGNLGIGTCSPNIVGFTGKVLTINGTGNYQGLEIGTSGTTRMTVVSDGLNGYVSTRQAGMCIVFEAGAASEKMRITSDGKIGIGTTSPTPFFQVCGNQSGENVAWVQNTNSNGYGSLRALNNLNCAAVFGVGGSAVGAPYANTGYIYTDANVNFAFSIGTTEKMRITSAGNVGIGTSSPIDKFEVAGGIHTSGTASASKSCTGYLDYYLGQVRVGITGPNTTTPAVFRIDQYSSNFSIICTPFYITATSNVGVNTTSPSYRLHVNGTFYAAGSSIDYKQSICNYNTDSCLFMCLKPKAYQYKEEWKHLGKDLKSGTQIGLIAEEVAESHPELAVLVNEEDNQVVRNVDYEKLSIILLAEVQKLRQEVDQLNQK
jgi:hypothetical protein